ncbi:hypothetical protein I552_6598 [Mycobacterium xenopi 3993]|nr:hypothetical protein I552_6598 [Mycobacterium xenopi 3993]
MNVDAERYLVTRTIAARPEQIFAVLADPSRHHSTEPTDWVRDAGTPRRSPRPDRSSR